jgi:hypothetical protein
VSVSGPTRHWCGTYDEGAEYTGNETGQVECPFSTDDVDQ